MPDNQPLNQPNQNFRPDIGTRVPDNTLITPSPSRPASSPVPAPAPTLQVPPNQPTVSQPQTGHVPRQRGKKLLLGLVLLLLIGGAVAAYMMVTNKVSETDPVVNSETTPVDLIRIGSADGAANNLFPKEGIGISFTMNRQVYEGLVVEDNGKYLPLLATSWTNPDEETWVFKLKPNVKFHSGKSLTANDVKRSLEALKKIEFLGYITSTIDKVEVVNDLEVKITTTEPDALLLNRLAIAYVTDQDAKDAEGNDGTGAYTLDKTASYNETTATLVANDNYHQGRPKTRKLVYTIYTSDAKMNADLASNKLDLMNTIPSQEAVKGLEEAGFDKVEFGAAGTFGLFMNQLTEDAPLKNKAVRHALAQSIDREAYVKELANNTLAASQVVPKSLPGHDAHLTFPKFDVTAAKKTLADAGLSTAPTLKYVYIKEVQLDPPILIKQLEAAGFKIEVAAFDEADPALGQVYAGDFDLFSATYTSDLGDSRDLLGGILESKEQDYPVYKDAVFDKLLDDSDKELDPTRRIALLQQANKYITDNVLWIPLRSAAYITYFKKGLDVSNQYDGSGSVGVYFWKVGQKPAN